MSSGQRMRFRFPVKFGPRSIRSHDRSHSTCMIGGRSGCSGGGVPAATRQGGGLVVGHPQEVLDRRRVSSHLRTGLSDALRRRPAAYAMSAPSAPRGGPPHRRERAACKSLVGRAALRWLHHSLGALPLRPTHAPPPHAVDRNGRSEHPRPRMSPRGQRTTKRPYLAPAPSPLRTL
jgi:hypothetical protein